MSRLPLQAPVGAIDRRTRAARRTFPAVYRLASLPGSPVRRFLVQMASHEKPSIVSDVPGNTSCKCPQFAWAGHCDHIHLLDKRREIVFGDAAESDYEGGEG